MSIHRTRLSFEGRFVQIPNEWMRDTRLSRRARGLLAEIMTHSEGWTLTLESLVERGTEGRDALRSAIKELEDCGYLRRNRVRDDQGRLGGIDYILQEPDTYVGKPDVGSASVGETATKNTNSQEHQVIENNSPSPVPQVPHQRKRWSPSDAAYQTAVDEVIHYLSKDDLPTITIRYEVWCHDKKRQMKSSEWLQWVIRDEQEAKQQKMKETAEKQKSTAWHYVDA
jgi:hypothetical protein